jgi:hypothetical protein
VRGRVKTPVDARSQPAWSLSDRDRLERDRFVRVAQGQSDRLRSHPLQRHPCRRQRRGEVGGERDVVEPGHRDAVRDADPALAQLGEDAHRADVREREDHSGVPPLQQPSGRDASTLAAELGLLQPILTKCQSRFGERRTHPGQAFGGHQEAGGAGDHGEVAVPGGEQRSGQRRRPAPVVRQDGVVPGAVVGDGGDPAALGAVGGQRGVDRGGRVRVGVAGAGQDDRPDPLGVQRPDAAQLRRRVAAGVQDHGQQPGPGGRVGRALGQRAEVRVGDVVQQHADGGGAGAGEGLGRGVGQVAELLGAGAHPRGEGVADRTGGAVERAGGRGQGHPGVARHVPQGHRHGRLHLVLRWSVSTGAFCPYRFCRCRGRLPRLPPSSPSRAGLLTGLPGAPRFTARKVWKALSRFPPHRRDDTDDP